MALFHFTVTQTKRSKGQSAIASAAYRSGEKLYSEYYGEYSDYTRKRGVICSDILLPPHAPKEYADRQTLWNVCALPGFVDSKNEEKTERNAGYLVVSQSGGGMLRQDTREGIRRTPANRGMRAHRIVKALDISEDVCHGMCP